MKARQVVQCLEIELIAKSISFYNTKSKVSFCVYNQNQEVY